VLERALERPWIGHGFHSFRNVIPPFGTFESWHAHNELIQQFYAYGVVGIILLIGIYGSFYRQIRRICEPTLKTLFLGLIVFILVRGLGDTERFDLSFPLWSMALLSLMPMAVSEVVR
jgi:O-antigen ligase